MISAQLINEIVADPNTNDANCEYIEIRADAFQGLNNLYLVALEGDTSSDEGTIDYVINLSTTPVGSNGLLIVTGTDTTGPCGDRSWGEPATRLIRDSSFNTIGLEEGSITFLLIESPNELSLGDDLDPDDTGSLSALAENAEIKDSVGWLDGNNAQDRVYSDAVLQLSPTQASDAAVRFRDSNTANSSAAWYFGELTGTADSTDFNLSEVSINFPLDGELTPGLKNLGEISPPALLINEVVLNPNGADGDCEYIELRGEPNRGLNNIYCILLEGDGDANNRGTADRVFDLTEAQLGNNGLLIIRRDVASGLCVNRTWGAPATNQLVLPNFLIEDKSVSILLVQSKDTLVQNRDYDQNDDGIVDNLPPNAQILDGVGVSNGNSGDITYIAGLPPLSSGAPDMIVRFPENDTTSSAAAWFYGEMDGLGSSISFDDTDISNNFPVGGVLTPGTLNEPNTSPIPVYINEIVSDLPGNDSDCEYIELKGDPNLSLENLYILSLEGDGSSAAGRADLAIDLSTARIGSNGLLVIRSDLQNGDCADRNWGTPRSSQILIPNFTLENTSNSFLLVRSLIPLTQGTDYDQNNDGTLDNLPAGARVIDGVGYTDNGPSDIAYGAILPSFSEGAPDALIRFPGNNQQNSAASWFFGEINGANSSITFRTSETSANFPEGGIITPGIQNEPDTTPLPVVLNEIVIDPSGVDSNCEYIELRGDADIALTNLYFVAIDGNGLVQAGKADLVVDLSDFRLGTNGLLIIRSSDETGDCVNRFSNTRRSTQVLVPNLSLPNNSSSFFLIRSTLPLTVNTDYDIDNNGVLDSLPAGSTIIDGVGYTDNDANDIAYGAPLTSPDINSPDALVRFVGNNQPLNSAAWYFGELRGTNESLIFDTDSVSSNFPPSGRLSPGIANNLLTAPPLPVVTDIQQGASINLWTLTWSAIPNQNYAIDFSTGLTPPLWIEVGRDQPPTAEGSLLITLPNEFSQGFFRVRER